MVSCHQVTQAQSISFRIHIVVPLCEKLLFTHIKSLEMSFDIITTMENQQQLYLCITAI